MKILFMCPVCANEKGAEFPTLSFVEPRDDGLYKFTCDKEHETYFILETQRYQILFEIGINAIVDGYYREAVSSVAAALERFYEYYINAISVKYVGNPKEMSEAWKMIASQSERQIGAYIFMHLIEQKKPPIILSNKWRNFRNNVVHKGAIPAKHDAIEFSDIVLEQISDTLASLMNDCDYLVNNKNGVETYISVTGKYMKRNIIRAAIEKKIKYHSSWMPSTINKKTIQKLLEKPELDVQKAIDGIISSRELLRSVS